MDTKEQQPVLAWAIKAPDGTINLWTISNTKSLAIEKGIIIYSTWKRGYRRGYRCVRVRVQEVGE